MGRKEADQDVLREVVPRTPVGSGRAAGWGFFLPCTKLYLGPLGPVVLYLTHNMNINKSNKFHGHASGVYDLGLKIPTNRSAMMVSAVPLWQRGSKKEGRDVREGTLATARKPLR